MTGVLLIALLASATTAFLIVRFSHLHLRATSDTALGDGPQKIHHEVTPRIGGVAVTVGLLVGVLVAAQNKILAFSQYGMWLLCIAPVFFAGLAEDMSKKVSARWRLFAAFAGATFAWFLLGGILPPPGTEQLASQPFYPALCFAFTLFAVGGVTHAFNIIDGLNGLLGGAAILIVSALGWMSNKVGDPELFAICLSLLGGVTGFLFFNFPLSKLFAGDAGAYLIGFLIAEISVLLPIRHPDVSPWFPMLLVIYPVTEALFSIYRRHFLKNQPVGQPDALHLHSLLYKRIAIWVYDAPSGTTTAKMFANSFAAVMVWLLILLPLSLALLFHDNDSLLIFGGMFFVLCYISLYWGLVRFKTPHGLIWIKSLFRDRKAENANRPENPVCRDRNV